MSNPYLTSAAVDLSAAGTGAIAAQLKQYANDTAPNGTFGSFSAPSILGRDNASVDVVLQWTFTQGSALATGFLLLYNLTGAASLITDAAYLIDARPGAATYSAIIAGVNPSTHYSMAIIPFAITKSGRTLGSLQTPASWQNFQPAATPNFQGALNGTAVTTVVSNAANGQTAFTDTAQFRGGLAPTNAPASFGRSISDLFGNGTGQVQVSFSYSQGANIATHFAIYVKYGGGTILISDPHFLVSAGAGGTFYLPFPISMYGTYSFGVAAVAMCKDGPAFNATIAGYLNDVPLSQIILGSRWGDTAILNGAMTLNGIMTVDGTNGKIDCSAAPFLVRQIGASPAVPNTKELCAQDALGTYKLAYKDAGGAVHYWTEDP